MIEIRPFDGDVDALVDLINRSWQSRYLAKDLIPVYDRAGLEWQVLSNTDRDLQLVAYEAGKAVGCLLAEERTLRVLEGDRPSVVRASQGSWFSVLPEHAKSNAGIKLINAMGRRLRERELECFLGLVNASASAPAKQFWSGYAKAFPNRYQTLGPIHFQMRFLRHQAVADGMGHPLEALGVRTLGWLQRPIQTKRRNHIRAFETQDLPDCQSLLELESERHSFASLWTSQTLGHQLAGSTVVNTLVFERSGVCGWSTTMDWPMKGQAQIETAVVDQLVLSNLNAQERSDLLAATVEMANAQGKAMLIVPRFDWGDAPMFAKAGFVPIPSVCHLIALFGSGKWRFQTPAMLPFR